MSPEEFRKNVRHKQLDNGMVAVWVPGGQVIPLRIYNPEDIR